MPGFMIHLFVAKKVNPDAKIDFYIGNIAPDSVLDNDKKRIGHLRNAPNIEAALKEFALKTDIVNEYLKGMLLHLFVDWKFYSFFLHDSYEELKKYWEERDLIEPYAFHNTDWAYELWEQMDLCDMFEFVEINFILKEEIKAMIKRGRKWRMETKTEASTVFPPSTIDKFATDTANDFNEWLAIILNKE